MHELTGAMQNIAIDYKTQKAVLTLVIDHKNDALRCFDDLHGADKIAVKIDRYRVKRSLNANNYAWKLISEIGNELRESKESVYFRMLQLYGQSKMISVLSDVPIGEYVKYFEEVGETTLNGKDFKHYKIFKGSSEFNTREMSIFIDGVISEAQELGIQTMTPAQIAELKSLWSV